MNHIGDTNKMVSDTPRTNNFDWSFHLLFAEAQKMERELNAAKERIKRVIAERDTAQLRASQNWKIREEFRALLGTDDVAKAVAEIRQMKERIKRFKLERQLNAANERIKRLEAAGDEMEVFCDAVAAHNWHKAKEAKL